ncbi:MAG: prolyl oligopeptidase family serine peptidase [Actinobacteria bacterium]|nr:prolyl oligopeptidase family serine peptidase [Actinomycetota bacterium]
MTCFKRWISAAVLLAMVGTLMPLASAGAAPSCTDGADKTFQTAQLTGNSGLYSRPSTTPTTLVVFDHGYQKPATAYWDEHLRDAANHGVVAVAPNYTGIGGAPDYRGWNVSAGAADSIADAKYFLKRCPSIKQVVLMGISMGGNASGLAIAADAKRADGSPLFDYWFDVEGATDVAETYIEARLVAPSGNAYADMAYHDIEKEMGGSIDQVPDQYQKESVVTRVSDIGASGLKGVVIVHGVDDGLVPYNQSREMANVLRANQIPTEFYSITGRGKGESGTTLTGDVIAQADPTYESPMAGHGAEESKTQLVITTAFDRLWDFIKGTKVTADQESVVFQTPESHRRAFK